MSQVKSIPTLVPKEVPKRLKDRIGPLSGFFVDAYLRGGSVIEVDSPANNRYLIMAGPRALRYLSSEGIDNWRAREFRQCQTAALGAHKMLVAADGLDHHRLRTLQRSAYSRDVVFRRFDELQTIVKAHVDQFATDDFRPARELLLPMSIAQLGAGMLGMAPTPQESHAIASYIETIVRVTLSRHLPESFLHGSKHLQDKICIEAYVHRVCEQEIRQDGSGCLLEKIQVGREQGLLNAEDVWAALLGPFVAGMDQLANTLAFLLYCLTRDEARYSKVVDEISGVTLRPASLKQLVTLRACVLETLRLYPVAPAVQGTTANEFEFDGYRIPANVPLVVGTCVSHFLPEIYPQPFDFNESRFLENVTATADRTQFAAFGVGRHACLAAGLAIDLIVATAAAILQIADATQQPGYELQFTGTPAPAPKDLTFRLKLRT